MEAIIRGANGTEPFFSVTLHIVPQRGDLIAIENVGGFNVLEVVHHIGNDDFGREQHTLTVFVDRSCSRYLPSSARNENAPPRVK